jgi:hypothetical protein
MTRTMDDLNHLPWKQTALKCVYPIFFLMVKVEALAASLQRVLATPETASMMG